jgi:hypothetical protein
MCGRTGLEPPGRDIPQTFIHSLSRSFGPKSYSLRQNFQATALPGAPTFFTEISPFSQAEPLKSVSVFTAPRYSVWGPCVRWSQEFGIFRDPLCVL